MNKIQIMILGKTEQDVAPIVNQLNNTEEWQVNAFTDKETAINHFQQGLQDVVIFHDSIEGNTKAGLSRLFQFQEEDIILLTAHPDTDIWEQVNESLHHRAYDLKPRLTVIDDALKNASFNICLN